MNHLSDEQIQIFLDNKSKDDIVGIKNHLDSCEQCKLNFLGYQSLFVELNQIEQTEELSANFSKNTIKRIEKLKEYKTNIIENFIIATIFIICISVSIYFFNLSSMINYFKVIDLSFVTELGNKILVNISPNILYLTAAVIISIIIELIDRFKWPKSIKQINH